ncbi:MAG: GNAT family N-acetyltransferase [Bacteroidia bacterium]
MQNSNSFIVTEPVSDSDFEIYYTLRFNVLRKPWGHEKGSEVDETDPTSIHAFIKENGQAIAVSRLHFVDENTGQIRYMGVHPDHQGKGVGRMVLTYLEKRCLENGRKKMILHARENAVKFYESCGYKVTESSYLLWGEIPHWLMEKILA